MLEYIFNLLGDIKRSAEHSNPTGVYLACKIIVPELQQLDRQDFRTDVQADFVRLISIFDRWSTDIRGVDVQHEWQRLEPAVSCVLHAYAGEGSKGDPNFLKKQASLVGHSTHIPPELANSLPHFSQDHPDPSRCAFIMMQFGKTRIHDEIVTTIRATLGSFGLEGLRADDREYHEDLFSNVLTYIHGCAFGIAVFERLEADAFNPNVALEVGYMRALRKPLCLLKDQTQRALPTDLVGKLYKDFDPQNVTTTIPLQIEKWLKDRDMVEA